MPKGKVTPLRLGLVLIVYTEWQIGIFVEIYYSSESIDSKMMFGYFSKVARLIVCIKLGGTTP